MSDRIEGYVADIRFSPGHPSGEIQVSLRGEPGTVTILAADPEASLKIAGEKYLPQGVVKLLYLGRGNLFFSGEEIPGRSRTCRKVEFSFVPKE